jgi:signal transduction histidine kinase
MDQNTYKQTILVVDDLPENIDLLDGILRPQYKVKAALNGENALKIAFSDPPDLILLDIMMPEMDGYAVCEQLKADAQTCDIPVIFISALEEMEDKVKAFYVGGVDFIMKPFQAEEVLVRVETHLSLRNMQKRLQEQNIQLQRYATELQDANAELAQYAYVVSHDLKAPLRAIHNYARFLREDLEPLLHEEHRIYLDGLSQAVQEADTLIKDILELSRIERGTRESEVVDIGAWLRSLISSLLFPPDVKIIMKDDWPMLAIEPVIFRQIFQNLLSNAVKFNTSPHKQVELDWGESEEGGYEFSVRDNGIGIDSEFQTRIFQMFRRLHTREEFEGTGIGLAIVKKAVSKLRGTIRVESEPGKGSSFFVTLPIPHENAAPVDA